MHSQLEITESKEKLNYALGHTRSLAEGKYLEKLHFVEAIVDWLTEMSSNKLLLLVCFLFGTFALPQWIFRTNPNASQVITTMGALNRRGDPDRSFCRIDDTSTAVLNLKYDGAYDCLTFYFNLKLRHESEHSTARDGESVNNAALMYWGIIGWCSQSARNKVESLPLFRTVTFA